MKSGYIAIGLLLLCCVLYYAYYSRITATGLSDIIDLSNGSITIDGSNVMLSTSSTPAFTHSLFIYFKDGASVDSMKIISRGDSGAYEEFIDLSGGTEPKVTYNITHTQGGNNNETTSLVIPIQKWVHITYVISENTIETYKDGTLMYSEYFTNPNLTSTGSALDGNDITIGESSPNISGYIAKYKYFNKALNIDEITAMHNDLLSEIGSSKTQDEYGLLLSLRQGGSEFSNLFSI